MFVSGYIAIEECVAYIESIPIIRHWSRAYRQKGYSYNPSREVDVFWEIPVAENWVPSVRQLRRSVKYLNKWTRSDYLLSQRPFEIKVIRLKISGQLSHRHFSQIWR